MLPLKRQQNQNEGHFELGKTSKGQEKLSTKIGIAHIFCNMLHVVSNVDICSSKSEDFNQKNVGMSPALACKGWVPWQT